MGSRRIDGLLADLGVSSHQFDEGARGFSTRFDAPLDMRMNQRDGLSAADIAATYTVEDLTRIFRLYGELKRPDKVAHAIARVREDRRIARTGDLMEATQHLAPRGKENQFHAQVFQAFRIEVNDELGALKALLESTIHLMEEGGRLAVISYHSLEDRLVKHFMRSGNFEDDVKRDLKGGASVHLPRSTAKPSSPTKRTGPAIPDRAALAAGGYLELPCPWTRSTPGRMKKLFSFLRKPKAKPNSGPRNRVLTAAGNRRSRGAKRKLAEQQAKAASRKKPSVPPRPPNRATAS